MPTNLLLILHIITNEGVHFVIGIVGGGVQLWAALGEYDDGEFG
jgi:hypothetical protein